MSKNTRLIATAIPRQAPGIAQPNGSPANFQVSVMLSPQLFMRGSRVRLKPHYYEIYNWPLYGTFFQQAIRFRVLAFDAQWKKQGDVLATGTCQQDGYHPRDLVLWHSMMPSDTPVSHWQEGTAPYELADLVTSDRLQGRVRQALEETRHEYLQQALDEDAEAGEQENRLVLLRELAALPIAQLLNNVHFQLATDLQSLRNRLDIIVQEFEAERDNLLLRLELEDVHQRNVSDTREFHTRYSAYAQHPELLRRTGWLWDYNLPSGQQPDYSRCAQPHYHDFHACLNAWQQAGYQLFITLDERAFQLSDPTKPDYDAGVFTAPGADLPPGNSIHTQPSYLTMVTQAASRQNPALRNDVPGYNLGGSGASPALAANSDPGEPPFWLAFLNELAVHCPLTAVELFAGRVAVKAEAANWRVRNYSGPPLVAGAPRFEQFRDYVDVRGLGDSRNFVVGSQLIDRIKLYQRLEALVKRQRSTDGVSTAPDAELLATTSRQPPPVEGYVGNGITLYITQLRRIVAAAIDHGPNEQRQHALNNIIGRGKNTIAELLTNSVIVYQHNVQHGYRADVVALDPGTSRLYKGSLCTKTEEYYLPDGTQELPRPVATSALEGWLSEPAQIGNDGRLYVDEELFHWNDWNLVTPFGNSEVADPAATAQMGICICSAVQVSSQVPLRYGWKYSFALRPADLCGNGAPPLSQRLGPGGDWVGELESFRNFLAGSADLSLLLAPVFTEPICYQRVDGVPPPRLLPAHPPRLDSKGNPIVTEHLTTLVVRSCFDPVSKQLVPNATAGDVRRVGPPGVSLQLLLQHGLLDARLGPSHADRESYLRELIAWDAGQGQPTQARHRSDEDYLNYLADPLADGFVLELDGHAYPIEMHYATAYSPPDDEYYWRSLCYHRLRLVPQEPVASQEASLEFAPGWPANPGRETVLKLRQGFSHEIRLRCKLSASSEQVLMLGLTEQAYATPLSVPLRWSEPAPDPGIQMPVTLVHAVEKPCLLYTHYCGRKAGIASSDSTTPTRTTWSFEPEVASVDTFWLAIPCHKFNVWERLPQTTELRFELRFAAFPVLTSGAFRLHAFTVEAVCDRRSEKGYRVEFTKRLLQAGLEPERGRSTGPNDPERERNVVFANLRHALPTSRHYRVSYELEAVSRFGEYFPPTPGSQTDTHSISGSTFASFETLTAQVEGTKSVFGADGRPRFDDETLAIKLLSADDADLLHVLSSSRPLVPVIEKIVPLLHWHTEDVGTGRHVQRRCHAFRVYFEGDWYSSGWDEQVAVLFKLEKGDNDHLNAQWDSEALSLTNVLRFNSDPVPNDGLSISQLSSQFGSDPISTVERIARLPYDDFFMDKRGNTLKPMPVQAADLEWTQPPHTAAGPGPGALAALELHYVQYTVCYASPAKLNQQAGYNAPGPHPDHYIREGRFYIDIYLCPEYLETEYFPFLRFALARYQPHSIRPQVSVPPDPAQPRKPTSRPSEYYRFSKVVLTDFCQPLPRRELILSPEKGGLAIAWPRSRNPFRQYPAPATDQPARGSILACYRNAGATATPAQHMATLPHPIPEDSEFVATGSYRLLRFSLPGTPPGRVVSGILPLSAPDTAWLPAEFLGAAPEEQGTAGTLTLAEYEYYENDELQELRTSATPALAPYEASADPRLDPRYRLIFSYLLSYDRGTGDVRLLTLLLMALLGLASHPVAAQLLFPLAGQADRAYHVGETLKLTALPFTFSDTLVLESDLIDCPPRYTAARNERQRQPLLSRRCWWWPWPWHRPTPPPASLEEITDNTCQVGTFGRSGLHQLRVNVWQPSAAYYRETYYWFAYSENPGRVPPAQQVSPSQLEPSGLTNATAFRTTYRLLDSALRYSRADVLRHRWDSLLLKANAPLLAAGRQMSLVLASGQRTSKELAPSNPLALLVFDNKLASNQILQKELRLWLSKQLPLLLNQFTQLATSAQVDTANKPIAVLTQNAVASCVATLQTLLDPATSLPGYFDTGQLQEVLRQADIEEHQDSSVCRLLPSLTHFQQLQLVVRLRSAELGPGAKHRPD